MYTRIYQNSYVVLIITFIMLCVIFYLFQIGYATKILPNGKIVKKFSWKYPLAISLIVWVFWHFYLYPPADIKTTSIPTNYVEHSVNTISTNNIPIKTNNKITTQRINMTNWN